MKNKKYELIPSDKTINGKKLFQIRALKDFDIYYPDRETIFHRNLDFIRSPNCPEVHAGDLGGYVESEANLSQAGNCWIFGDAIVHEKAYVCLHAVVTSTPMVYGDPEPCLSTEIKGTAAISDNAFVYGGCVIEDDSHVSGCAEIYKSTLSGAAYVKNAIVKNSNIHYEAVIDVPHYTTIDSADIASRCEVFNLREIGHFSSMTFYPNKKRDGIRMCVVPGTAERAYDLEKFRTGVLNSIIECARTHSLALDLAESELNHVIEMNNKLMKKEK